MPVKRIIPTERETYPELVEEIVEEHTSHRDETPAPNRPAIIEEKVPFMDRWSITVIWDKWQGIEKQVRGRVIMDAYQKIWPSDILKISVVLGLTPDEASHLGIHF